MFAIFLWNYWRIHFHSRKKGALYMSLIPWPMKHNIAEPVIPQKLYRLIRTYKKLFSVLIDQVFVVEMGWFMEPDRSHQSASFQDGFFLNSPGRSMSFEPKPTTSVRKRQKLRRSDVAMCLFTEGHMIDYVQGSCKPQRHHERLWSIGSLLQLSTFSANCETPNSPDSHPV